MTTATIMPLSGKYYGTVIETQFGKIEVWLSSRGHDEPSQREMAEWPEPSPENGSAEEIRSEMMAGGHYESEISYRVAQIIVKALNQEAL